MTVSELPPPAAPAARRRRARSLRRRKPAPAIALPDMSASDLPPDPAMLLAVAAPEGPALDDAGANAMLVRVLGFACAATVGFDVVLVVTSV